MIRIKPLHTRIFNDILSLVTKPQCGISVYVSYRVLLTHCQEPFSGHPTELVCFDAVVAVPSGPSVLCIDLLYRLLYCFNQPTHQNLTCEGVEDVTCGMGKKRLKDSGTAESRNLPLGAITVLIYCAAFPLQFLFFLLMLYSGQRDTVLLLASSIKASSVVKVKRRNRRRRDLITLLIYSVTSS